MAVASLVRPAPKRQIDPQDIITVRDAAALFQCSPALIYKLVADRKIPFYRIPGSTSLRFLRGELLELLTNQEEGDGIR